MEEGGGGLKIGETLRMIGMYYPLVEPTRTLSEMSQIREIFSIFILFFISGRPELFFREVSPVEVKRGSKL